MSVDRSSFLTAPSGVASVAPAPTWQERAVRARLATLRDGRIELRTSAGTSVLGAESADGLRATVEIHDPRAWHAMLTGGSIGAGESYAEGWWSSPDPVAVVRLMVRNRDTLEALEGGLARVAAPLLKLRHLLRRNTRTGARRNVAAHYDLSNDFFRAWLDPSMAYSSGIFARAESTLEEASAAKFERLCHKLALHPGERLLEIGCGWGGLAIHAARRHGVRVTAITISARQREEAEARVRAAGLADRVEIRLCDYRELTGTWDKVVSVEMIEAVGAEYYDEYFRTLSERLEPHGAAAIQAITIADRHYETARRRVDFIQRHIFPGSCIPSMSALFGAAARASDLTPVQAEDFAPHYARTLMEWRRRFHAAAPRLTELGFDARFRRLWDFYFIYCAGGFAERQLGVAQILFAKPAWRGAPLLPVLE